MAAAAGVAADGGAAPRAPWHARLHECLAAAERAVAALLAVCEEPDARAALEARDFGWADAVASAQLETATLLRRIDLVTDHMWTVRMALAWRAPAASRARSTRHDPLDFASLPLAVALHVFSFLPADQRARAAVICHAWRAAVAEPSLWTRLDLSPASGVKRPVSNAVLRGAAALARGRLEVLDLNDCATTQEARLEVVTANADSLRELSCGFEDEGTLRAGSVEVLLNAAPQLRVFHADTAACVADAIRMLRNEAPFGPLRLRRLALVNEDDQNEMEVLALAAAMPDHAPLRDVIFSRFRRLRRPAMLDAFATAALTCRLRSLMLIRCRLSPASVPALARVIRGGALTSFHIENGGVRLLDEPAAIQLADAFAASQTLLRCALTDVDVWNSGAAAAAVMQALTGHHTICEIRLDSNRPYLLPACAALLGALVATNTPALRELRFDSSNFGDVGLAPLFNALPQNTHLRVLQCSNTSMSADFARDRFLPAVTANTSLRKLIASEWWGDEEDGVPPPEVLQAEALVATRAAADAA